MTNEIFTALYTKASNPVSSLFTALAGRLYNTRAPQNSAMPYCVMSLTDSDPDYYFGDGCIENYSIQFSLFDNTGSSAAICALHKILIGLYDDAVLNISGLVHVMFERESAQLIDDQEIGVFAYNINYRGLLV
jgi:hypothetical protein